MEIIYRWIAGQRRMSRRARTLFLIAAVAAAPSLAATFSHAAISPDTVNVRTLDDDADGHLDAIRVTFSTQMNTSQPPRVSGGPGSPGFRVTGYVIDVSRGQGGFTWSGSQTLDVFLVEGPSPDTGQTPTLVYVAGGGGAVSTLGNEFGASEGTSQRTPVDGAGPVLVKVEANDVGTPNLFRNAGDELFLTFSEPTLLAGGTKMDRWSNLERAIRFTNVTAELGGTCPGPEGDGGNTNWNFPQPKALETGGADPILKPAAANEREQRFHVKLTSTAHQFNSSKPFAGIPQGCWISVDPIVSQQPQTPLLSDQAGNVARSYDATTGFGRRARIEPLDAVLESAKTIDANADGVLDGILLDFNLAIDENTLEQTFTVSHGGANASVDAIEIGANPDLVKLTISGVSWHTGVRPVVSYAKPASCSAGGGQGLKARVPFGGSWRTCVASINAVQAADGAAPAVVSSSTRDTDGDGHIDRVRVTFSETITVASAAGWKVDGVAATAVTVDAEPNRHIASIDFAEASTPDTGRLPQFSYTAQAGSPGTVGTFDAGSNQVGAFTRSVATDGASPRITTIRQEDADGNGAIDRAIVTYSEPIVDPATAAGFTVGGRSATLVAPAGDDAAGDATLTLSIAGLSGTAPKAAASTATIADPAGNIAASQSFAANAPAIIDAALPVAQVGVTPAAPIAAGTATVTATFSEPMRTDAAPSTATFGSKSITPLADTDHTNGWSNVDAAIWKGTVTVASGDCTVSTGCAVTVSVDGATDPAGNLQVALGTAQTEIDTIAPSPASPQALTFAVTAGESSPEGTINMFVRDVTLTGGIAAGEAAGGEARVLLDGTALPGAVDPSIGAADTSITASTSFGSRAALQAAIAEGAHSFGVELCDDAGNCSTSVTTLDVTADYTPDVAVTLVSPAGGNVVKGGSSLDVTWDADDAAGFQHVTLAYSTDGGQTFPHVIEGGIAERDGTRAWTVPSIDAQQAIVRASVLDASGNRSYGASDAFVIRTNPVFGDVAAGYWARGHIEAVYDAGITGGCGDGRYCPERNVSRAQMAVFLIRALGEEGALGGATGRFTDVPASYWAAAHIERLADLGITGGCGGGRFCPEQQVSRAQMAAFLIRAMGEEGNLGAYRGDFSDVPASHWAARHIEHLASLQVTGGCGGGRFCPDRTVTRAQMAVFLQRAFDLPML